MAGNTETRKKSEVKKKVVKSAAIKAKPIAKSKPESDLNLPQNKINKNIKKIESVRPLRPSMASIINESSTAMEESENKIPQLTTKKFIFSLISVLVLSSSITYGITHKIDSSAPTTTTFLAKISGGVALSESELKSVIFQLKRTVYWTGPQRGAKYTINALTDGQTYIRYLPDGKGVADTAPNYRTVGTYESADAYTATLAAGNEANGVSFTTADGRVIHYNKSASDNVYLAYKGKKYQIEIFDPKAGAALKIANNNEVKVIR